MIRCNGYSWYAMRHLLRRIEITRLSVCGLPNNTRQCSLSRPEAFLTIRRQPSWYWKRCLAWKDAALDAALDGVLTCAKTSGRTGAPVQLWTCLEPVRMLVLLSSFQSWSRPECQHNEPSALVRWMLSKTPLGQVSQVSLCSFDRFSQLHSLSVVSGGLAECAWKLNS